MSRISKCVVRNCGNKTTRDLCDTCMTMVVTGVVNTSSAAWFVTELLFMEQQNNAAMKEVAHLHSRVNELSDD